MIKGMRVQLPAVHYQVGTWMGG